MEKIKETSQKKTSRIIGIIPARMAASRFPGKPLKNICGVPMIRHVIERSKLYNNWSYLAVATCDNNIKQYCDEIKFPCIITSKKHKRALDRVKEAVEKLPFKAKNNDIVLNVQGDEPMMRPDMITKTIKPFQKSHNVKGTILCMKIVDKEQYYNPDIVKVLHNLNNEIIYTSRSPVPYSKYFTPSLGAKRIYGIFAFKWNFLQKFSNLKESPLELKESCDSNRLYDNNLFQHVADYPYIDSFSVDSLKDLKKVEKFMKKDNFWKIYKNKIS